MNLFKDKNMERRIGPKFGEGRMSYYNLNKVKPRLYEEKINFDRMRKFRLQRIRELMENNNVGAIKKSQKSFLERFFCLR